MKKFRFQAVCERVHRYKIGVCMVELIQWKTAKMRGNKPFHGFCGFIFRFLSLFSVSETISSSKFAPPFNDSRQLLKGLNRAGAEPCAGRDNLGFQRCLLPRQIQIRKAAGSFRDNIQSFRVCIWIKR